MSEPYEHHLIITFLAEPHLNVLNQLAQAIAQSRSTVRVSRSTSIGTSATGYIYCSGNWSAIAKLEVLLQKCANQKGVMLHFARSHSAEPILCMPYRVQLITPERPTITADLINFFSSRRIKIMFFNCDHFVPKFSQQVISKIQIGLLIPNHCNLPLLRDEFAQFCDESDLDAYLECDYAVD